MGYKFNPFTGNLDEVGAGGGGGTPGGSDTQIQFNDAGSFGGDVDLTWNKTTNVMTVAGDVNLSDGGSFTTTLQTITPTANRTVSIPDATGTLALVAGSSGQPVYNNAGAYAGLSTATIGTTGNITLSLNGAASTPPVSFTGTWFTGGTGTTTKPQLLIEPTGTTSTAWSTSGTGLGVNAASGFSGNLLDLQVNGSRVFNVDKDGIVISKDTISSGGNIRINADANQLVFGTNQDIRFIRDAAGILAQRNGGTSASPVAQAFRLYNFSVNPASDYERAFLRWSSNVLEIGTEGAGTGTTRPMRITAATLKLPNLPTYADNAAATTGGLVAGDVYKTATGELRITV